MVDDVVEIPFRRGRKKRSEGGFKGKRKRAGTRGYSI
jgi:hypothetical protein